MDRITQIQLIEAAVIIVLYVVVRLLINRSVDRITGKNEVATTRSKIVKKAIKLLLFITTITLILSIFGVDQSELAVFIGSLLTVMGIALFAQWSILSNITSGIILFFNHTIKLGDKIMVMDKDYEIEGEISDIKLFFVIIETKDREKITIPNNVLINKMIKKRSNN